MLAIFRRFRRAPVKGNVLPLKRLFREALRRKERQDDSTWQRPLDMSRTLTREERHEQIMAAYS